MEIVSKILLGSHIFFGSISLIVFWLPAIFTKKGGEWHNKIGRIYVWLMWFVVISAALLCIKNVIVGTYNSAIFLGFLTLITAHPIWHGTAILNYKKEQPQSFITMHMVFRAIIFLASLGLITYGAYLHFFQGEMHPLFFIFGILGGTDLPSWIKELKSPIKNANWLIEHLSGMIISGIAAYTAFFAFGGRAMLGKILTGYWQILPWILPTIIGVIAIKYQKRKYEKKKSTVVIN